jgi:excisionase family DNA binding protein
MRYPLDMSEGQTPLYVRLSAGPAKRLESAVAVSGKSKRQLVEEAVGAHLSDAGLVIGSAALREQPPEVLTAGEAAAMLRVSERQLLKAVERGELPGRRIGDEWRFSREALSLWLRGDTDREGGDG